MMETTEKNSKPAEYCATCKLRPLEILASEAHDRLRPINGRWPRLWYFN